MKHHLFSRFTSVLLAVVLLAGLMGTPILATDNVLGAEPAATVEEQTVGSADESDVGVDSAEDDQAEATTTDEEESASSDSSTDTETSGEDVVADEETDSAVPAGDESDSTVTSEEESTDSAEGTEPADETETTEETEPVDETEPTDKTEPAEEAASELTTSVLDENGSTVADVTVEAAEGVIPEGAKLVAELLTGEKADKAAAELDEAGVEYDGYMALDIHLENDKGEEVEPNGEVRVVMVAPAALPEEADPTTVAVQHHEEQADGTVKVEEVASAADTAALAAAPATLDLTEDSSADTPASTVTTDNSQVIADFTVESFSGFTVTWLNSAPETRAYIPMVDGVQPDGVQVNLFDYNTGYGVDSNGNNNGMTWFWPENEAHKVTGQTPILNTPKQLQFSSGDDGVSGEGRWPWAQRWENFRNDFNAWTKGSGEVCQDIVELNLTNGYPVIKDTDSSLEGLFSPDKQVENITSYTDVKNLFLNKGNGYYAYNSDENFAKLQNNTDGTNQFILYQATNQNNFGSAEAPKFLPFNDLIYKNGQYTVDGTPNYHFGMTIDFDFVQPANGLINGQNMVFSFTGDDDVWLFIDDMLVLDMGGIHNKATGTVNFATGDIKITHSASGENRPADSIDTTLYDCFKKALEAKGVVGPELEKELDEIFEEYAEGKYRFKDYSSHTFNYFYLERGAGGSNCQIEFNIPAVPTTDLAVSKQITKLGTNDIVTNSTEFTFELKKDGAVQGGKPYKVYKLDDYTQNPSNPGQAIRDGITEADGSFTLHADEVAVFEDIIEVNDQSIYTVTEVLENVAYADEIDSVHVNGEESETHAASLTANVRYASFNNWVKDKGEYSLTLTKEWKDEQGTVVPAEEIPFTEVQVDVEQYYKSGVSGDEQVVNSGTLTLTIQNDWTDQYGETVYNYTAFRAIEERVYVNDETTGEQKLVVTYTYQDDVWTASWKDGMQELYPEWTIGEFAFDRDYTASGSYFDVITTNADAKITIPASNCLVAKNNKDAVIWMPYLDALSPSAREALKVAVKASVFENGWGGTDGNYYLIDEENLPNNLVSAAGTLKNITYSDDGTQVTIEFTSKNAWNKVAAGEVKIDSNVTECSLSNILDKNEAKISIPVEKVWADDSGSEHDKITVKLMNGEIVVKQAVLSKDNNWSGEFTDLPKYDSNGNLIVYSTYTVVDDVEGYESSSEYEGGKFILTNTPSEGYLTINKVLEGGSETLGNGKDVFSFMIEAESGKEIGKVWYAHVNGDGMATLDGEPVDVTIDGKSEEVTMELPSGNYKITELSNINYTCEGIASDQTVGSADTTDGTITVKVGGNDVTTVTYTNSVQDKGLTDGSGVINKFKKDGAITFDKVEIAGDSDELSKDFVLNNGNQ